MTTTMAAARFYTNLSRISPNYASSSTHLAVGAAVLPLLPLLVIHDAFLWQEVSHEEVQCRGGGAAGFWCGSSKRQYIDENLTEETLLLCKIFNNSIPKWNFFIFWEFTTVDTILWTCKSISSPQARVTSEKSLWFRSLLKEMHDRVSRLILVHLKISSNSSTHNWRQIVFQPVGRLSILLCRQWASPPLHGQAQPPEKLELVFCSLIFSSSS